jgi:serine protease Do
MKTCRTSILWSIAISIGLGSSHLSAQETPEQIPPAPKPAPAKATILNHMDQMAIITGDVSTGTGFFVKQDEKVYLYTAAHVLAGNARLTVKTTNGRELKKFGDFELAADADLCRLQLAEEFPAEFKLAQKNSSKVGDLIIAVGNSGGAGALTLLDGEVASLGPDQIEITAQVIQGNSGGPVFQGATGDAVGVVTHLIAGRKDLWAQSTKFSDVRRFATRLDRDVVWEKVPIGRFLTECKVLADYDRSTQLLYVISQLNPTQDGLRLNTRVTENGPTLLSVVQANEKEPLIAQLIEMNSKLGNKRFRTSEVELRRSFVAYYDAALKGLNQNNGALDASKFTGQNREKATQSIEWRTQAVKAVKAASEEMK